MSETVDADLYTRTKALLEPGDIELAGCIVHTTLGGQEDLEMHELTVAINEVIADHAGKGESYIEAGNDDTNFSSNQFQGLTLDDEAFVWECQQLLRDGTFRPRLLLRGERRSGGARGRPRRTRQRRSRDAGSLTRRPPCNS